MGLGAGEVGRYGEDAEWALDQREDDGGSLVFTSPPITKPFEILGAPQVHLEFSSDKPQALVCVRLNDVAPDGSSTRVTVGLLNLTHRDSHEHAKPLTPGKTYKAVVDLDDIAHAFPKGHRIAVSISTVYWPIAWPSPELATLTITAGKSFLELPVRPKSPKRRKTPEIRSARPGPRNPGRLPPQRIHASPQGHPRFAERPDDRGFPALDLEEGNARHRPDPYLGRPCPL